MLLDCHAHLNFQAYEKDRDEVLQRCQNMKVINVGSQILTSRLAFDLAKKHQNLFATVGLHPIHVLGQEEDENEVREKVDMSDEEQLVEIRELLQSDNAGRIVAVGETGLDYSRLGMRHEALVIRDEQKKIFLKHIELAREFNKPLMLHCRGSKDNPQNAYHDLLEILNSSLPAGEAGIQAFKPSGLNGMLHCFSSDLATAKKFINLDFSLGLTGIITFPPPRGSGSATNAGALIEVVKQIPLQHLLTETDCPYLAPQPVRGQRNEPRYVEHVARKIAEIKGVGYDEVTRAMEKNAREVFGV